MQLGSGILGLEGYYLFLEKMLMSVHTDDTVPTEHGAIST